MGFPTEIIQSNSSTTSSVSEGSNLYFTLARARAALSGVSGILLDPITGVVRLDFTTAILDTTSTIDDSNTAFVFTIMPQILVINGKMYRKTGGDITWTWSGQTATLSQPVGLNNSIWGLP